MNDSHSTTGNMKTVRVNFFFIQFFTSIWCQQLLIIFNPDNPYVQFFWLRNYDMVSSTSYYVADALCALDGHDKIHVSSMFRLLDLSGNFGLLH